MRSAKASAINFIFFLSFFAFFFNFLFAFFFFYFAQFLLSFFFFFFLSMFLVINPPLSLKSVFWFDLFLCCFSLFFFLFIMWCACVQSFERIGSLGDSAFCDWWRRHAVCNPFPTSPPPLATTPQTELKRTCARTSTRLSLRNLSLYTMHSLVNTLILILLYYISFEYQIDRLFVCARAEAFRAVSESVLI